MNMQFKSLSDFENYYNEAEQGCEESGIPFEVTSMHDDLMLFYSENFSRTKPAAIPQGAGAHEDDLPF